MKIAIIGRVAWGARNAFAHIAGLIEERLAKTTRLILVEDNPLETAQRLKERDYRVIILYGLSTSVFIELRNELAEVAKYYPVIAGGPHAAGAYWQILRLGAYAVVVGDGEPALEALVDHFQGNIDISKVPNIAYKENGKFKTTRIVLAELDNYKPYSITQNLYPPIEIMRGCGFHCSFCQVPSLSHGTVRFRSIENTLEAVKDYIAAGKTDIRFVAPVGFAYMSLDMKNPNPEAIEELLRRIRGLGGKPYLGTFPSETRPEFVTPEVLKAVKRYGANKRIAIGLQVASNSLLERIHRGHTVEQALQAIQLIKQYGFQPVVDILMSLPSETDKDVQATAQAMIELANQGAKLRLHTFLPLPGTPLARAKPKPIHPIYRKTINKLIGKGVLEGDWKEQEKQAIQYYCTIALDPKPTPDPQPLPEAIHLCKQYWRQWTQ